MSPFQKSYNYTQKNIQRLWAGFTELNDLHDQLQKTQTKLQEYVSMTDDLNEIKRENQRLRDLLGFKERIQYDTVVARIISKDPDNWYRTIILDKGTSSGIEINMPVLAFNGDEKAIVGKIIEVRGGISRVLPIISNDMKVGVILQENRTPGLMSGYATNDTLCVIDYITKAVQIKEGERVVTSGQGGIFPEGILVGTVKSTSILKSSAFQRAIVKPTVDYNRIEEVFIVKKIPDPEVVNATTETQQQAAPLPQIQ